MRTRSKPLRVERVADRADAAVHHVGRRDHVAAGLGLDERLAAQELDRLVVRRHHRRARTPSWPCVVNGSSATSHITPSSGCAFFTARTARQTRFSGLSASSPSGALALGRRRREERDQRNAERLRLARRIDQRVDREPVDPRHRRDRLARRAPVMDEHRPDEVGGVRARARRRAGATSRGAGCGACGCGDSPPMGLAGRATCRAMIGRGGPP